jgi:ferredoxin
LDHYGKGIAKGMAVTFQHLFRQPITTQYPEQRLIVSRRTRGNELIWQEDQCSGCATCARSCPLGVIQIRATGQGYVQAPCSETCPAHINIPRYVKYISEGKPADLSPQSADGSASIPAKRNVSGLRLTSLSLSAFLSAGLPTMIPGSGKNSPAKRRPPVKRWPW